MNGSASFRFPPNNIRINLKRLWHGSPLPLWHSAPSVTRQRVDFRFLGRELVIEGDHRNPIYDTICELTDYDSYQLSQLHYPDGYRTRIIDIGGNIGISAACFAQYPNAQVICLEPAPHLCAAIQENLARNNITNVRVIEAAVTDSDGEAVFVIPTETDICGYVGKQTEADQPGTIKVRTMSFRSVLDLFAGETIDLIKIDCEGGEFAIVDQMSAEDAARIRAMTFEVHETRRNRLKHITAKLAALGYSTHYKPDMYGIYFLHHILAIRED